MPLRGYDMSELPDLEWDISKDIRIIHTPNFTLMGRILLKYPEDLMAYYYAARTRIKKMEINHDRRVKKAKKDIENFLGLWDAEAAIYIKTSYEKDAAMSIEISPNVSVADVKGLIYEKYWYNREEREWVVSQVLAPNGKVMLMYNGEPVVPDMEKPPSFLHKIFGR